MGILDTTKRDYGNGFRVSYNPPGQGNCQFLCMVHELTELGLLHADCTHLQLRAYACDHIEKARLFEFMDVPLETMRIEGECGNHTTLHAMAHRFNVQIIVLFDDAPLNDTILFSSASPDQFTEAVPTILLGFDGEGRGAHYVCLEITDDSSMTTIYEQRIKANLERSRTRQCSETIRIAEENISESETDRTAQLQCQSSSDDDNVKIAVAQSIEDQERQHGEAGVHGSVTDTTFDTAYATRSSACSSLLAVEVASTAAGKFDGAPGERETSGGSGPIRLLETPRRRGDAGVPSTPTSSGDSRSSTPDSRGAATGTIGRRKRRSSTKSSSTVIEVSPRKRTKRRPSGEGKLSTTPSKLTPHITIESLRASDVDDPVPVRLSSGDSRSHSPAVVLQPRSSASFSSASSDLADWATSLIQQQQDARQAPNDPNQSPVNISHNRSSRELPATSRSDSHNRPSEASQYETTESGTLAIRFNSSSGTARQRPAAESTAGPRSPGASGTPVVYYRPQHRQRFPPLAGRLDYSSAVTRASAAVGATEKMRRIVRWPAMPCSPLLSSRQHQPMLEPIEFQQFGVERQRMHVGSYRPPSPTLVGQEGDVFSPNVSFDPANETLVVFGGLVRELGDPPLSYLVRDRLRRAWESGRAKWFVVVVAMVIVIAIGLILGMIYLYSSLPAKWGVSVTVSVSTLVVAVIAVLLWLYCHRVRRFFNFTVSWRERRDRVYGIRRFPLPGTGRQAWTT